MLDHTAYRSTSKSSLYGERVQGGGPSKKRGSKSCDGATPRDLKDFTSAVVLTAESPADRLIEFQKALKSRGLELEDRGYSSLPTILSPEPERLAKITLEKRKAALVEMKQRERRMTIARNNATSPRKYKTINTRLMELREAIEQEEIEQYQLTVMLAAIRAKTR